MKPATLNLVENRYIGRSSVAQGVVSTVEEEGEFSLVKVCSLSSQPDLRQQDCKCEVIGVQQSPRRALEDVKE